MGRAFRQRGIAAVSALFAALTVTSGAHAADALIDALKDGTPLINIRARYETVSDDNCGACAGQDADARTLRARLGYITGAWHSVTIGFAFDQIWSLGPEDYNSKTNGRITYPVVADPTMTALDRLYLTYRSGFGTTVTAGRQIIVLDDARFVGNVGFRQHEQSFDAVRLVNTSLPHTALTYVWIGGVNRIFGPDGPSGPANGHFISNSHVLNASYTGISGVKLTAYAYLLDLKEAPAASTATYGLRAAWHTKLVDGLGAAVTGAYAHQNAYADNPNSVSLDYWKLEGALHYTKLVIAVGYEAMGGNGTVGFATPLATLHAFDGWADLFLATPANGIDDLYARLGYKIANLPGGVTLAPTVIHHSFTTDRTGVDIGEEWDLALNAAFDANASLNLSYADYSGAGIGAGGFRDKSITWLTATYKY